MGAGGPPPQPGGESRSYRLISALGQGGFGSVFRGELRGSSGYTKQVAIKLLNEEASKVEDFKARLRDEARLLALLRHRAIVHMEDLVRIYDRWAVVMEFVEGADLKELLNLGPLPPRPACELAAEVASALQVAHEAVDPRSGRPLGIVHRDIKPANIRITPSGEVKVLDFGVARAAFDDREALTRSMAFGSMGYLAPERFDGKDTPAADVYALGVVLLEALTAAPLGQLSVNPKVHGAKVRERLAALPVTVGPEFGAAVAPLLGRMIAYDHEVRPTAHEVAERFQDLLIEAPGPWLKRWVVTVMARVAAEERAVDSGSVERVSDSQAAAVDPGLVLSGGQAREPRSGDSLGQPAAPTGEEDSTRAAVRAAVRDFGGIPGQELAEPYRMTEVLDGLARQAGASAPRAAAAGGAPTSANAGSTATPGDDPDLDPRPVRHPGRLLVVGLALAVAAALAVAVVVALAVSLWPQGSGPGEAAEVVRGDPPAEAAPPPVAPPVAASMEPAITEPATPPVVAPRPPAKPAVRAEAPSPAPASAPRPSPAAAERAPASVVAPSSGKVVVVGNVLGAKLRGSDGKTLAVGEVPAGTYTLLVAFPSGANVELPAYVKVTAGQTTTVRCDSTAQACR